MSRFYTAHMIYYHSIVTNDYGPILHSLPDIGQKSRNLCTNLYSTPPVWGHPSEFRICFLWEI